MAAPLSTFILPRGRPPCNVLARFSGASDRFALCRFAVEWTLAQRGGPLSFNAEIDVTDSTTGRQSDGSDSSSISSTLLARIKARRPEAWQRLVELYGPEVYGWCRRAGIQADDAADVVQEVFAAVAARVADFRRERPGDSFAAWLGTIARNKIRDHFRRSRRRPAARGGTDAQQQFLQVPEPAELTRLSDAGGPLSRRALELVRAEFENRTWEAFLRTAVDGQPPAGVAEDLGMSVTAVYKAKSRVLRRLRQELAEL